MEIGKNYTIAKFAEKAGVSKQAIYKQISNANSQIAPYIIKDGHRTLIDGTALSILYGVEPEISTSSTREQPELSTISNDEVNPIQLDPAEQVARCQLKTIDKVETQTNEVNLSQPARQENSTRRQAISDDYIEYLKAQIAELKAEKAQAEERFNSTIREKDDIIKQQSEQLAHLSKQVAEIAKQMAEIADKALITTSQQQYLTAVEKVDKQEPTAEENVIMGNEELNKSNDQPKKSFWKRLFR